MAYNSTIITKKKMYQTQTKHGYSSRSGKRSEYVAWKSMKNRCYSKSYIGYNHYGGRGITVCDRWRYSFENFISDMGDKPTIKHSLDRIITDGNYEPSNCRWATRLQQNTNNRRNKFIEYNGQTKTTAEWARLLKITQTHLCNHLEKRTFHETVEFFRKKKTIYV